MKFYDIDLDVQSLLKYEPKVNKQTGEIVKIEKGDKKGHTKYVAQILIDNAGSFDVEKVSFSSKEDPALTLGAKPVIENLRLMYWSSDTGSGITFLADNVTNSGGAKPASTKTLKDSKLAA